MTKNELNRIIRHIDQNTRKILIKQYKNNDYQLEPPHLVEDGDSWVVKSNDFKYTKLSPSSRGFTTIIIYFPVN